MRVEELVSRLTAFGWVVSIVGCHSASIAPGSDLESVRYNPVDEKPLDTYTVANINITYEDEHGETYTETSEVCCL